MARPLSSRAQRLRDGGHKLTKARLTILNILEAHDGHLTSAQVLDEAGQVAPEIGRASVFRALDLFTPPLPVGGVRPT